MSGIAQHRVLPPPIDEDSRWWWDGLRAGRLLLPRCQSCDRCFFPPQPTCPFCGSPLWKRIEASGRGRIYSWVIVHVALDRAFDEDVPYTVVAVELDEGPRIFGRIANQDGLSAGVPVHASIYTVADVCLLGFEITGA